ncbi:MAG: c-type cytochrome [Hyphomicrobiaceae bacterium]|nr:c-type cytochrome [Hyphomicrobiaceae bacterium]
MIFRTLTLAATLVAGSATFALAEGDAGRGEALFRRCGVCHQIGEGAENRTGPVLTGVVGRAAGTAEGFEYSAAFQAKAGEIGAWTTESLAEYIANPARFLGAAGAMPPQALRPNQMDDLIAYLATFSQ